MSDYLTTSEVAELLRIKERKVYDLASSGVLPCSKVIGKLLFPKAELMALLQESTENSGQVVDKPKVLLGSHDPLLEWALRESLCNLAMLFDGSADGLQRFTRGEGIAAGIHLHGSKPECWNVEAVDEACGRQPVVLLEWAKRQRGLIVSDGAQADIQGLSDLLGKRVVPRQAEAGAQQLFLHLLAQDSIDASGVEFVVPARSETGVAQAISEGVADAGFGLQCVAAEYRLHFIPLLEERFDLLIDRKAYFEPEFQRFLTFCRSSRFNEKAQRMPGYNVSDWGRVHFNG